MSLKVGLLGGSLCLSAAGALILWHRLMTPQHLESPLPGEAHLYRWRHGHIFYSVSGPEEAPPLIVWHAPGLAASAYEMRRLVAVLGEHYRVYAPDLAGFGLSDRPALPYSGALYAELAGDFLRDVVGKPAILLARGLSCLYAVSAASAAPELCSGLILLSPPEQRTPAAGPLPLPGAPLARLPLLGLFIYCLLTTRVVLRWLLAVDSSAEAADLDYLYATSHQFGAEHAPRAWLAGQLGLDMSTLQRSRLPEQVLIVGRGQAAGRTSPQGSSLLRLEQARILALEDHSYSVSQEIAQALLTQLKDWQTRSAPELELASEPALQDQPLPQPANETATQSATVPTAEEQAGTPEPAQTGARSPIEAYCVKCRQKTSMLEAREVTMKNGRPALQGVCALCGSRLYRIGRLA
jgi:pimeloyl-ACP methyl ester carboxylesterase